MTDITRHRQFLLDWVVDVYSIVERKRWFRRTKFYVSGPYGLIGPFKTRQEAEYTMKKAREPI